MGAKGHNAIDVPSVVAAPPTTRSIDETSPVATPQVDALTLLRVAASFKEAKTFDDIATTLAAAAAETVGAEASEATIFDAHGRPQEPRQFESASAGDRPSTGSLDDLSESRRPQRPAGTPSAPLERDPQAVVPVLVDRTTLGMIRLWGYEQDDAFSPAKLDLVRAIGYQAGLAVLDRRATELARRRADHFALHDQTARAIGNSLDIEELCATIYAEVRRVLTIDTFYVALLDEGTEEVWFPFLLDQGRTFSERRYPVGGGPTSEVLRTGRSLLRRFASEHDQGNRLGSESPRSESSIYVPIPHGERIIGVLSAQSYLPDAFDTEDVRTLELIARQSGVAIANAQRYADAQHRRDAAERHAANLEAVLATSEAVTSEVDLSLTLAVLADHLERLIPHDALVICRIDHLANCFVQLTARVGGKPWTEVWDYPLDRGVLGRAIRQGAAELVNNAHLDPDAFHPSGMLYQPTLEHLLVAPLTAGGGTIGGVVLTRTTEIPFSDDDFALFRVLAGQAGVAIQTSLLLDDERRRRRYATALVDVAGAFNRAQSLAEVARHLAIAAPAAVGVDHGAVYIYDEHGAQTIASFVVGDRTGEVDPATTTPPANIPIEAELLRTGRPLVGEQMKRFAVTRPRVTGDRLRDGVVLPILSRGKIHGSLYVWSSDCEQTHALSLDDYLLLEAISDHAGTAIERTRLAAATARRVAELRILGDISAANASSLNAVEIVRAAMEFIQQLLPFNTAAVTRWDESAAALRVIDAWGPTAAALRDQTVPIHGTVSGHVFRYGKPYVGTGNETGQMIPAGVTLADQHVIAIPMRTDERTIGVLFASRIEPGPFLDDDQRLLMLVAGQLAVGIERARVHEIALAERQRSDDQAHALETVLEIGRTLALQPDLDSTLNAVGDGIARLLPYSSCALTRFEPESDELVTIFTRSVDSSTFPDERIGLGRGLTGLAAERREPIRVAHADRDAWSNTSAAQLAGIDLSMGQHVIAIPLVVEGALIGALTVFRIGETPFSDHEFAVLRVYAGQAGAAIRNIELVARNRDLYRGGVRALAAAVDAKDPFTRGHAERVGALAGRLARAIGCGEGEIETIELAALLHDIGKIGIPDRVLQRPGPLDDAERTVMMEHAALGETILVDGGNDSLRALAPLIRHHHEWFDGGGYPDGLAGEAIPLGAAIIAVADAFDTIVTDRPYRRRQSAARALDELRRSAGSQFRPDLVEALAAIVASTPAIVEPPPTGQSERPPTTPIAGRIGDARALSLLVELATLTRRIPDLAGFLTEVAAIVRRRLNYEDVYLHLVQRERGELMLLGHDGETPVVEPNHRQPLDAGVCGEVIRTGLASNIPDLSARPHVTQTCPIVRGSELWVPLMVEDEVIGIISVSSRRTAAFTSNDEAILSAVAGQVAAAINVAKLHDELRQAASTDGLTGLINHRVFYTKLDEAVAAGAPFSVVLFDVEGLKVVNDTFGHLAGDSLLRHIGTVIREHVRPADTVARYGGDEFAAILVGLDAEDAARSAARIRRQLCADDAPSSMTPTVRYGVASFPTDGRRPHDLVGVADRRLYQMRDRRARLAKIS